MSTIRLLLVGSDPILDSALRQNLELDGYQVDWIRDVHRARAQLAMRPPHLVIIGSDFLSGAGSAALLRLRGEQPVIPCLVLSTSRVPADRLEGFVLGWDELVLRPVSVGELHVRIEWLLRRTVGQPWASLTIAPMESHYRAGELVIDPATRTVTCRNTEVAVRPKEFDLLLALARASGRVVSRVELLRDVWGYSETVFSRTVDAHILQLRRKLEDDPQNPRLILTCLKAGYRLAV